MPNRNNWRPFYFNGNQAWGMCDTRADWERIVLATAHGWGETVQHTVNRMLQAHQNKHPREYMDFGLYNEYTGSFTLGAFAASRGMDLTIR